MIVSPSLVTGLPGRDSITATRLCRGIPGGWSDGHARRDRTRHNSALGIIPELGVPDGEHALVEVDVIPVGADPLTHAHPRHAEKPDQALVGSGAEHGSEQAGGVESRHFRGHFHYAAFGVQLSNWRS